MKNFDQSRSARRTSAEERAFTIGGETFVAMDAVRPEDLVKYESITKDTSASETLNIIDGLILSMIEQSDDAATRYRAVRARRDDPITLEDLQELTEWLVERQTGRPTGKPASSSPGLEGTGNGSTDVSSSPVLAAVSEA